MYLFFNNTFLPVGTAAVSFESKAFRYGELVFETMRLQKGSIMFFGAHFERISLAANVIGLSLPKHFNAQQLEQDILKTAVKNKQHTARIRVTLFGGNGGLFENEAPHCNILIETYPLQNEHYELNSNGLDVCIYDSLRKQNDILSSFKNGNFMLYNLAAQYSKQQKCNEALILNAHHYVIESTISNLFIIKNTHIYTPPLTDGCIAGIMRKYILETHGNVTEKSLSIEDVLSADEVFVSNVTRGIQWVKQIADKSYSHSEIMKLWIKLIQPLNK